MMLFAALLMKYYLHLMIHFNVAVQMKIIHAAPILTYIANQQKIPIAVILMNMYAMDNANISIFHAVTHLNLIVNTKIMPACHIAAVMMNMNAVTREKNVFLLEPSVVK